MATPNNDLQVYKAENRVFKFVRTPPSSIAGWTTLFTVKHEYTDVSAIFAVAGVVLDATKGWLTVTLGPTQTTLTPGDYVYDFTRTDLGSVTVLSTGKFQVLPIARII